MNHGDLQHCRVKLEELNVACTPSNSTTVESPQLFIANVERDHFRFSSIDNRRDAEQQKSRGIRVWKNTHLLSI